MMHLLVVAPRLDKTDIEKHSSVSRKVTNSTGRGWGLIGVVVLNLYTDCRSCIERCVLQSKSHVNTDSKNSNLVIANRNMCSGYPAGA